VPPATSFRRCLANGIRLQEAVEVLLIAPTAAEVVELDLASGGVADDRVNPIRQLHGQVGDFAAEELGRTLLRRGQAQALAGSSDGGGVTNLRFDNNEMGQGLLLCSVLLRLTVDASHTSALVTTH
jgi:hypothetical protein